MSDLIPPDRDRCQADVPTQGPFQLGGEIGDPNNGYRRRCRNAPAWIATETRPGRDGLRGSMSLCEGCKAAFVRQVGASAATFEPVKEAG